MVNERQVSSSLSEVPSPSHTLSDYEIQVKEETFNLFHREQTPSPVIFQNKKMKKEIEDFDGDSALLEVPSTPQEDESDEETIATFITAAGQQLALYAVEDSDEIFAVAVYDDSGEPPSDFQFLMRDDVEKLIGEGAVRTVKKTSQFKKQVYDMGDMQPPTSSSPEAPTESPSPQKESIEEVIPPKYLKKEPSFSEDEAPKTPETDRKESFNFDATPSHSELYESWPSDNVFLVVQENPVIEAPQNPQSKPPTPIKQEPGTQVIEKSVQYILSDDPPPDPSDLTLADIEKILKQDKLTPSFSSYTEEFHPDDMEPTVDDMDSFETIEDPNLPEDPSFDDHNQNINYAKTNSPEVLRIKRPRKQQLTTVNRADSEIIIQPAIMTEIEDDNSYGNGWKVLPKKRGRRKKKKDTIGKMKKTPYLRTRKKSGRPKKKRKYRIEVIDIDVEDREIITLEDGKEKGSSDKENDVIMVGDSDEDDDEDKEEEEVEVDDSDDSDYDDGAERRRGRRGRRGLGEMFKCQRCRRDFRGKRGLEMHLRMCAKNQATISERTRSGTRRGAPVRSAKLKSLNEERTARAKSRGKKEYKCKSCHERFEVVVALARHVRLMHSLKKKINTFRKEEEEEEEEEEVVVERAGRRTRSLRRREVEKKVERSKPRERFKKGQRGRIWRNAGTKRINCWNCRRWFPSLATMLAHSLQHATKKIEKSKIQRCGRCQKVFRSKYLYIRHLRSHSNISTLQKEKSYITKQSVVKTPIKKRGRPQKS